MPETARDKMPSLAPTTRWSLVVAAADQGNAEAARLALEQLCQIYWRPVLHFILRKGFSVPDAQDLTQDFFMALAGTEFLQRADPAKGRFRALVFTALKHRLIDAGDRLRTLKRGHGQHFVPLEEWMEEEVARHSSSPEAGATAEELFDRDWANLVVQKALSRLREDFAARGKQREYEVLQTFLSGAERGNAYADAALDLRLPVGTVKAMVHRVRIRYGVLLREEVAHTLADLRDLDDEVRHLCQILSAPRLPAAGSSG